MEGLKFAHLPADNTTMKQSHRIVLTASDLRAALIEYMAVHGGDFFPSDARIQFLTEQPASDDANVVEVSWGDEEPAA